MMNTKVKAKTVTIDLGARSYEVRIGHDLLSRGEEILPWLSGRQVCIVSDEIVAPLYLQRLRDLLADKQIVSVILPAGEATKTMHGVAQIFDALLSEPCDRDVTVIALGGGVVGDIAGFAAACYQRGVAFVQIPTTLLAQVDSSVGGKTGVNHARGKNMIGAFHQPRRVIADTATLVTLEARQFAAGMAEVIKYGVISDREFFVWLEKNIDKAMARDDETLARIIEISCQNKAKIVAQDERESGARALLNLGHTFAHAIETATGYEQWLHGEAVATGIAMAATMAQKMNRLSPTDNARISALLTAANLPTKPFTGVTAKQMLTRMQTDKKTRAGKVRLILPKGIGNAEIVDDYPQEILQATVEFFTSPKA